MRQKSDLDLDTLLRARFSVSASDAEALADRIIAASERVPQAHVRPSATRGGTIASMLQGLLDAIAVPQPVLAMTIIVLLGFYAGSGAMSEDFSLASEDEVFWQAEAFVQEGDDMGGWL